MGVGAVVIAKVNEETVSFLLKTEIPVENPDEVKEAREAQARRQKISENKEEARSLLGGNREGQSPRPPQEPRQPAKTKKIAGRNDRVSVQYTDGSVKKDVKFKTVEEDVRNNRCVIID